MEYQNQKPCPTCGGQGYMYQIDAQLGGDLFRDQPDCHSQKVTCPRCGGSGVVKVICVLIAILVFLYLTQ